MPHVQPGHDCRALHHSVLCHSCDPMPLRLCTVLHNDAQSRGGGVTTTGPDATHPPAICQNLGGSMIGNDRLNVPAIDTFSH